VNDSVARNPDFFLSPFGALANGAAHSFIFMLGANHTEDNPDGIMDPVTLASLFAVEICDDRCEDEEKGDWQNAWHGHSNTGSKSKPQGSCHIGPNHGLPKCPKDSSDFKAAGKHGHRYKYVSPSPFPIIRDDN
jgi:hypothetical protein